MTMKIIKICLFVVFLVLATWFCVNNAEEFVKLVDIPLALLIAIIVLHAIQLLLNAWVFKLNILVTGHDLRLREWLGLRLISQLANMVSIFRGGTLTSFAYLKYKYKIKLTVLLAIFLVNSFFTIYSLIPPLVISGLYYLHAINIWYSALIILPFFIIALRPLFYLVNKAVRIECVYKREKLRKSLSLISSYQRIWTQVVVVNWVFFYVAAYGFQVCFLAIGADTKFETNLTFVLLSTLSNLVSLTPGNFGIQESIIAITSSRLDNVVFADGVIVSAIHRIINIILVSLGALVFTKILFKDWNPRPEKN